MNRCYLDDFVLHDRVQPLDEGLHRGVLSQQLLQLLEDGDGVIWKEKERPQEEARCFIINTRASHLC